MKHSWLGLCLFGWLAACGSSGNDGNDPNPTPTPTDKASIGYRLLRGLDQIAEPHVGTMRLYSSHNKSDASNIDFNQYIRRDPDGSYVMVDHTGPGVITRIWMTARIGTSLQNSQPGFSSGALLKIYVDGSDTPLLSISPTRFFSGEVFPFVYPLVNQHSNPSGVSGKGFYSYVPISFSSSVKVTLTNPFPSGAPYPTERVFYQVNVLDLTGQGAVPVSPIRQTDGSLTLSSDDQAAHQEAISQWQDPASYVNKMTSAGTKLTFGGPVSGTAQVAAIDGAGTIRGIRLFTAGVSVADLEKVRLRITWDGATTEPAVNIPLGTGWGSFFGRGTFQGLLQGASSDGTLYLRMPMPFRKSAKIELASSAGSSLPISAEVYYDKGAASDARYLHADFASQSVSSGDRFLMAQASGAGHVLGWQLAVNVHSDPQALEGDEFVTTDGTALWKGTGTEDGFNAHWFFEGGLRSLPLTGATSIGPRLTPKVHAYRFLAADASPFGSSMRFELESGNAPGNTDDYRSVVFYYLAQ